MPWAGLPFGEDVGGSGLPYRSYLMVLEELSRGFAAFGLGLSVHSLVTVGIDKWATPEQRERFVSETRRRDGQDDARIAPLHGVC